MALEVLVVDDEADIRELVAGVLEDEGYAVRSAADSTTALDAIDDRRPSLVLLDVWLQGSKLDGLQLLEQIKKRDATLPVLMISGHGNLDTAVAAIREGAVDFIEKPFKADRLLHLVGRPARRWIDAQCPVPPKHSVSYTRSVLLVVVVVLHMVRVVVFGSYKPPREAVWLSGLLLLGLILAFSLTGYLLPWDQRAYWATVVTINIARLTPLGGETIGGLLQGGASIGALTLTRWYALHVIFLPAALLALVVLHVVGECDEMRPILEPIFSRDYGLGVGEVEPGGVGTSWNGARPSVIAVDQDRMPLPRASLLSLSCRDSAVQPHRDPPARAHPHAAGPGEAADGDGWTRSASPAGSGPAT